MNTFFQIIFMITYIFLHKKESKCILKVRKDTWLVRQVDSVFLVLWFEWIVLQFAI